MIVIPTQFSCQSAGSLTARGSCFEHQWWEKSDSRETVWEHKILEIDWLMKLKMRFLFL